MKSLNRQKSSKYKKSTLANTNDSHFRISSHIKTLNLPLQRQNKNKNEFIQEQNSSNRHYEQLGLKLRSTQLESTNHDQRVEEGIDTIDAISPTLKFINKTARIATFSAYKHFPQSPVETARRADEVFKTKTQKNAMKNQSANPERDVQLRLSLANFHQKLKAMNFSNRLQPGSSDDKMLNLKLQGVQYAIKCDQNSNRYNGNSIYNNGEVEVLIKKTRNYKKGFKMSKEELSNLDQFNKLLSKIHLESNEEDAPQLAMKRLAAKTKRMEVQSASQFRKKQVSKKLQTRENVKVNVINIAESKPFQEKPRCHQIYMKYFLKSEDCCIFQRNQGESTRNKAFTQSQLTKELKEIKKQIVQRHTVKQRKPLTQEEKFTKYTTSFIEQKLIKRKSLIKNYTFKKRPGEHRKQEVGDDFFVEGWEAEPAAS